MKKFIPLLIFIFTLLLSFIDGGNLALVYVAFLICAFYYIFKPIERRLDRKQKQIINQKKIEELNEIANRGIMYDYDEETIYLYNPQNEKKFFDYYKSHLSEDDDYFMSKKELIEYSYLNRVYKYEPFKLTYKIDDCVVSAMLGDQWVVIGEVSKDDLEKIKNHKSKILYLYPNIYKEIDYDEVKSITKEPYFAFKCETLMNSDEVEEAKRLKQEALNEIEKLKKDEA